MRAGTAYILKGAAIAALAALAAANISLVVAQSSVSGLPLLSCKVFADSAPRQAAAAEAECRILIKLTRDAGPNWWQGSRSASETLKCSLPIGPQASECDAASGPQAAKLSELLAQGFQAVEAQALPLRLKDPRCRSRQIEPVLHVNSVWDEHRDVLESVTVEHRVICEG
jgi:hypothetical protein